MFNSKVWRQHRVKRQKAPSHQPPHQNWHRHALGSCSVPSAARNSPEGTTSLRNLIHAQRMPEGGRFSSPWDIHLTRPGSTKLPWRPDIPAWGPQPRALPTAAAGRMKGVLVGRVPEFQSRAFVPFHPPDFHMLGSTGGASVESQECPSDLPTSPPL